jgi:hypothetical protein
MIHVQLNIQTPLADRSSWIVFSQSFCLPNLVKMVPGGLLSTKRYLPEGLVRGKERECLSWFHGDIAFNRLRLYLTRMILSANVLLHCNAVFGCNVMEHLMNMLNKTKPW